MVGASLAWRAGEQPGLLPTTRKMSWLSELITGSLLYFRNMAIASGDTCVASQLQVTSLVEKYPPLPPVQQ